MTTPTDFLREAVRAVPAVKYALGVGGIIATIAIIYSFKMDPRVALFGTIIMLLLMVILVVFANMATPGNTGMTSPATVLTWFSVVMFMLVSTSLFSSVFFQKPLNLSNWVRDEPAPGPDIAPNIVITKADFGAGTQRVPLLSSIKEGCIDKPQCVTRIELDPADARFPEAVRPLDKEYRIAYKCGDTEKVAYGSVTKKGEVAISLNCQGQ